MTWPSKALMVHPEFFNVEYAINPHMLDENGELNKVDTQLALKQWEQLKSKFMELGTSVEVIPGKQNLPDMVFCANQTFPFLKGGKLHLVLSSMHSEKRQPEVEVFKKWAENNNVITHELQNSPFEGMGDVLWNYESGEIFAGYGFRTSPEVYAELEKIVGQKITTLELVDDRFYHLDTCLAILNENTAAFVKEAFSQEGLATLKNKFSHLIEVPTDEACHQLACNMCTPNGKDVVIQSGAVKTNVALEKVGFKVHQLETCEFIKSGGSVFCMKMLLP